jgi:hypothetical protein
MKWVRTSVVATPLDANLFANCAIGFMWPWAGKGTTSTCPMALVPFFSLIGLFVFLATMEIYGVVPRAKFQLVSMLPGARI